MAKPTSCLYLLPLCVVYVTVAITRNSPFVHSATLQSDIQALKSFREAIDSYTIPPNSFLRTWNFEVDPCESEGGQFLGIVCIFPSLNSSSRVSVIKLDKVGYEGTLSPAIGDLSELTVLDVSNNKLRGQLPNTIYNLWKLTTLALSDNYFTGNIPTKIGNIKSLEVLNLSHNKLFSSLPKTISNIRTLTLLKLSNNEFSGKIPDLIGLWQLNTLDLSNNQFSGNLPQLPISLRNLVLSSNSLTGHLSPLVRLQSLKTIDLSDNSFSGTINLEIFTFPSANSLNLSLNSFSKIEVKENSGQDTQLRVVDVHGNHLSGPLPVNLATYENLTDIDLGNNEFRGQIPAEYGQKLAGKWRSLLLDHNFLFGKLPVEFHGDFAKVRVNLAQNCLVCPKNLKLCDGGQRPASDC